MRAIVALAVPPVVLAAILCAALAALVVCAIGAAGGVRVLWPVAILAGIVSRSALHVAPRRRAPDAADGIALSHDAPLSRLVSAEVRRLGLGDVTSTHATLGARVRVVRHGTTGPVVEVGVAWLVHATPGELRAEVTAALLRSTDRLARALAWIGERVIERQAEAGTETLFGPLWRRVAELEGRLLDAASAEREVRLARDVAHVHGAAAAVGRLRAGVRADAFGAYWTEHVTPCLAAGYRPPILAGWRRYLAAPAVTEWLAEETADAFSKRLAAAQRAAETARGAAPDGADEPVDAGEDLELEILAGAAEKPARELVPLAWDRVGDAVVAPALADALAGADLPVATVDDLADAAATATADELDRLGAALALALRAAGWRLECLPGEPLLAHLDDATIAPLAVPYVVGARDERAAWEAFLDDLEIGDLHLVAGDQASLEIDAPLAERGPAAETVIELPSLPGLRRRTAVVLALGLSVAVPLELLMAWEAVVLDAPVGARAFVAAMTVLLGAVLVAWVASRRRIAWSTGTLTLGERFVVLAHRGLLREPWRAERRALRAVVVDDGGSEGTRLDARFPYGESAWDGPGSAGASPAGFLWHRERGAFVVPAITAPGQTPNMMLIFDPPPVGPRARRVDVRGPLPGEALGGLLVSAGDPAAVQAILRERGLLRVLTIDDVRHLHRTFVGSGE